MSEKLIIVDENDNQISTGEKLKIHKQGILHRCFSIFVFNSEGNLLLQKRSISKYHSGGLWTNTCCSHPRAGEAIEIGVHRRLKEEMGFDCNLKELFSFIYKAELDNNLTEYEYDHVFSGVYDGEIIANPEEVEDIRWVKPELLFEEINIEPKRFTVWLPIALKKMIELDYQ